ncbi:hypothetical protein I302_105824 [Kwoniella bestiolae CBS 10118]|uniref:F-box domain-containing protein n=1 Tax=Kwoniella bestiolae CBS 10118 TaxID=1296100 RepID=A0A1B9G289_9TREE|nr:hypothetical protein I302_04946 [Kwoniella bestiolae CBS 10118]OCF25136.1 hypothetical protein I302_04946 [Kwoniella bestiolae CBS 10118]
MLGIVIFRSILHPFLFPLIWYGVELSFLSQCPPCPARTLHLPSEVLKNISSFSDQITLHSLIQVSWRTYDVSSPYLYHRLTITRENAKKVFRGLARSPPSVRTYRKKSSVGDEHKGREGMKDSERDIMDIPFGIFPPGVTMDSEDEDEDQNQEGLKPERSTTTFDYPTRRSHERKALLLSHVRHLTITSLPSKHISEDFKAHRGLLYDKNKRFPFIFDKVDTLIDRSGGVRRTNLAGPP